jgi:hypothetical protein
VPHQRPRFSRIRRSYGFWLARTVPPDASDDAATGTVEKHVRSILAKLNLPEADDDHRRVRTVITYLDAH